MFPVFHRRRVLITVLLAALLACGASFATFSGAWYCAHCAKSRQTLDWQLPFTEVTYWRSESLASTPLSELLASHGLIRGAQHEWLFAHGGGNGVLCALGRGQSLGSLAGSPRVVALLRHLLAVEPDVARRWVQLVLTDRNAGSALLRSLQDSGFPEPGFSEPEAFQSWWDSHQSALEGAAAWPLQAR
jgi:hypothetical protein